MYTLRPIKKGRHKKMAVFDGMETFYKHCFTLKTPPPKKKKKCVNIGGAVYGKIILNAIPKPPACVLVKMGQKYAKIGGKHLAGNNCCNT